MSGVEKTLNMVRPRRKRQEEKDVLRLLMSGYRQADISEKMEISVSKVCNIAAKYGDYCFLTMDEQGWVAQRRKEQAEAKKHGA